MILKVGQALAVSALIFSAAAPAHAEDVNITYAAFGPPTSTVVREGIVPFLDAMKDKSGGSITYTLHSGGSLAGATSMLDSIADGTADGGQVLTILNQPKLPLNAIVIGLAPAMTGDPVTLAAALTDYVLTGCPQCRKEYEDNNVVFLGAFATTRYQMLCREPVNGLADMKDKRVRASGDWGQLATALGATPVNMAVSEVYEGLQRGVLDCAAAPASIA